MKILYVCSSTGMYGDNIALIKLIPHLAKAGVEPLFLIRFSESNEIKNVLCEKGYPFIMKEANCINTYPKFHSLRAIAGFIRRMIFIWPKNYKEVLQSVKKFNPDIIHSNCSFSALGYKLANDLGIKHLWHIREYGTLDAGLYYYPSKSAFIKKINFVHNYSVCISEQIFEYFGSSHNGCTIYDGVFNSEDVPPIQNEADQYFLFVGRITEFKGVEDVIRTFLRFCETDESKICLKIAGTGDPDYEVKIHSIVDANIFGYRIEFLGYRNDIYKLMEHALAIIVASRFEAFGFITAEAMFNGCPVIGRNNGGTKMQFDNGVKYTGHEIGFRYNTADDMLMCLQYVARNSRQSFLSMLQDAQKTVMHFYTAKKSASFIFQLYKDILKCKD